MEGGYFKKSPPGQFTLSIVSFKLALESPKYHGFSCKKLHDEHDPRTAAPTLDWLVVITWLIAALTIGGVLARPRDLPEAVFASAGAILLIISGLLPWREAWHAVGKGLDVYLFLTGMMLLAEVAREEKLFDWLAAHATQLAKGSAGRLFLLVYLVGVVVTPFLSESIRVPRTNF